MAADLTPAEIVKQTDMFWRELFDKALDDDGVVGVSRKLGYSNHTLVSRIAKDRVPASDKFRARVIACYHRVTCPHNGQSQARSDCSRALAAPPTHNPGAMAHWRACQRCPHKPESKGDEA